MELELPLDMRGIAASWLNKRRRGSPRVSWHAPWSRDEDPLPASTLARLPAIKRMRLLRLIGLDGAGHGPWMAQAAGTAARLGRHRLAQNLMLAWLDGENPTPEDATVARALLEIERNRLKSVMQWRREWPSGVIHLEDMPAWLIPPAIRLLRQMGRKGSIHLFSGGHLLKPGRWSWYVPAGRWRPAKVEVVQKSYNDELKLEQIAPVEA